MEGKRNHVFENWARTYCCSPELYFEPESVPELRKILTQAKSFSKKVRVVGNGHSPSDIACTDDYMISMKNFNKVLQINLVDNTVIAEGGILLSELNEILEDNGLGLSVMGSVSDISLAGAVSVGTHGTGRLFGAIHSFVLEIDMMCADGSLMKLSLSDNAHLFNAALVSLGALGIILSLKMQCEPAFRLHQVQYGLPLCDVVENIDVHLSASDHFRFCWYPYTDKCVIFHATRTKKPVSRKNSWFWDRFIGYFVLELLYWLSTFFPPLVPYISKTYCTLQSSKQDFVDKSFNVFTFDCLFKQYVMEWAIPRENMGIVLHQLKIWIDQNFRGAHFPVEVRFVRQDDAFLSPSYGVETCYINIIMYRPYMKCVEFTRYWTAFQDIVMRAGGRPHWAKEFQLTTQQLTHLYPCWDKFLEIRDQLDPDKIFVNSNLQRLFF